MARGFFLVLEGVEGAGKTTQARLIGEWLDQLEIPHRLAREPGGTALGESIRELLLEKRGARIYAETELLLMLAARAAYVKEVVGPVLAKGWVMVSDRFELSSFAYQGVGRGLGLEQVRALNACATGGLKPDLTLVFDLPVMTGRARQIAAGKAEDRIEGAGAAFLELVGAAYRSFAGADDAVRLIDATGTETEVHRAARDLLRSLFPEPFGSGRG
jgi:dTMP kinase